MPLFQSTPDLVNREKVSSWCSLGGITRFQSTPDLVNREKSVLVAKGRPKLVVSIHSRFS